MTITVTFHRGRGLLAKYFACAHTAHAFVKSCFGSDTRIHEIFVTLQDDETTDETISITRFYLDRVIAVQSGDKPF